MKNLLLLSLITFLSLSSTVLAQEKISEFNVHYGTEFFSGKTSYQVINEKTNETVIFIEDYKKTHAYLLDSTFKVKSYLVINNIKSTYKELKGHIVDGDNYKIFLSNTKSTKYHILNFNFKTKTTSSKDLKFNPKKEYFVQSATINNVFYIINVKKYSSDLIFHKFNPDLSYTSTPLSFKTLEYKKNDFNMRAYDILKKDSPPFKTVINIPKIESNTPLGLETVSKPTKLYLNKDQFIFSFDGRKEFTHLFHINPDNFEVKETIIGKQIIEKSMNPKHNSFLFEDKIFQIVMNSKEMVFTTKNRNTNELIKEIQLNKKDSITFKNSPIYYDGMKFFGGLKEKSTEKTSKFLYKLSSSQVGVSVTKFDNDYKITLGGVKPIQQGGGMPMMGMPMGGMPVGGLTITFSINPSMGAYGGYSQTKSTRIECMFNNEMNHIQREIPKNAFDKIKIFEEDLKKIKLKNIYKKNGKYYFCYLKPVTNSKIATYHIYEF